MYSIISVVGLLAIVYGYGQTRIDPIFVWHPPSSLRHVTSLLVLFSFILLAATYIPGNAIKARFGHPMLLGVKVWAIAHLLVNGRAGDIVLFGAFLVWAVADFISCRRRDRNMQTSDDVVLESSTTATIATIAVGIVAYLIFALWLHVWLTGVNPFV